MLRFSLVPTQDSVRELGYYKPILDLLSKNTGKKIEFYMPTSYSSVVEALLGKWVDIAVLGPESYVIAKSKDKTLDVFGTYSRKEDGIQKAGGTVSVSGALDPLRVPPEAVPLARFVLERGPLTQFRNVPVEVAARSAGLARRGFTLPPVPPWPSESGNEVLFDGAPGLLRRGTLVELAPGSSPVSRLYVADRAVGEAWVGARAGGAPVDVAVEFGGRGAMLRLGAGESSWARLDRPRAGFPSSGGRRYYRLRVDSGGVHARFELAAGPGDAGAMLYRMGRYAEAHPLLARGAREGRDPVPEQRSIILLTTER